MAVPREGKQFLATGCLPDFGCPILTARDDPPAIRGKGHRFDGAAVPFEGKQFLAADRVPYPSRPIVTARNQPQAVSGKSRRTDGSTAPFESKGTTGHSSVEPGRVLRSDCSDTSAEFKQFRAVGRVPYPDRAIVTARDNTLVVRGKGD